MKIIGDYHTHSEYSHGHGNIRGNILAAINKGLKEIAITDHGPRSFSLIRLGVKKAEDLLLIKEKIAEYQKEFSQIKILAGVEANIINHEGDLDVPVEVLEKLDIVVAGLHPLILPPDLESAKRLIFDNKIIYSLFPRKRERIREWNTETVINAVKKNKIDFISHPGYQLDIDTYTLAKTCAEKGTYLEINSRHGKLTEDFVRVASKTMVKFIINSDAHSPDDVGGLSSGIKIVEDLALSIDRIVNVRK